MSDWWQEAVNALFKIANADFLDKRTKKAITSKLKNVVALVGEVEAKSGIPYPPYYVEPVLTVAESSDNLGGLGVMYARTIPIEANGVVQILVELSAPLVLYATKKTLKLVIAHELLHYIELVRNFTKGDLVSQITASSVYEERYTDYSRAFDPSKVFSTSSSKALVRDLNKKTLAGLDDEKLNEKCKTRWIEKKLPVAKIPLERNQVHVSMEAIMRSTFEPRVMDLVSRMT
ncbi:MAG TPA: hypothetical protein VNE86_06095 [Nitrososphaerales archaeon]|nr:hypothetical protein [Nitrososphaerales archaeon]